MIVVGTHVGDSIKALFALLLVDPPRPREEALVILPIGDVFSDLGPTKLSPISLPVMLKSRSNEGRNRKQNESG